MRRCIFSAAGSKSGSPEAPDTKKESRSTVRHDVGHAKGSTVGRGRLADLVARRTSSSTSCWLGAWSVGCSPPRAWSQHLVNQWPSNYDSRLFAPLGFGGLCPLESHYPLLGSLFYNWWQGGRLIDFLSIDTAPSRTSVVVLFAGCFLYPHFG
jgi:hypothetical protein